MFCLNIAIIFTAIGLVAGASPGTRDVKKQIVEVNEKVSMECPDNSQSFYPHPTSCSKFIECNRGEAHVLDCIDGLHYNPALSWCDFPENVNCNLEEEAGDERCPADGQHFYSYPLDCAKFVECSSGVYKHNRKLLSTMFLHHRLWLFKDTTGCEIFEYEWNSCGTLPLYLQALDLFDNVV
ncbi:SCRASP1 [Trypoxylus dichotomus]